MQFRNIFAPRVFEDDLSPEPESIFPDRAPERVIAMHRAALVSAVLLSAVSSAQAESGLASYYGGRSHGGEMTCAHRTRPFGTLLTVTHGGHTIQCRVNDRGPFVRGRIVDVSLSAARALGMMRSGVVRVSVH